MHFINLLLYFLFEYATIFYYMYRGPVKIGYDVKTDEISKKTYL
jgi:hypothetical protein